ncbi:MAG: hypothetical protein JST19_22585, partial [Bacteroidetes bacterium]|nr:hypothetical protein [Bacteroidota bacterium]
MKTRAYSLIVISLSAKITSSLQRSSAGIRLLLGKVYPRSMEEHVWTLVELFISGKATEPEI